MKDNNGKRKKYIKKINVIMILFILCIISNITFSIKVSDKNVQAEIENTDENNEVKYKSYEDDVELVEKYLSQQFRGEEPDVFEDNKKVVYLTFDDGPSTTVTPSILETLKKENVHATFFILGRSLEENPEHEKLLKQAVEDGNAIGNHTYSHDYKHLYPQGSVNSNNFMEDIKKNNIALKKVLGEDFVTRVIRFPGGHMSWENTEGIDNILKENDFHQIDWNAASNDAEGAPKNAEQLKEEVINTVGNKKRVVLLMHDTYGKEETAKALPDIIKYLKNQGYEFRTLK